MERGADVEADRQTVKLAHHGVFEADAHELRLRPEDLGSDETGDVVQVNPRPPGRARFCASLRDFGLQRPRKAVLARLVDHHVEALALAVGPISALARLEVQNESSGPLRRVPAHLLDVDVEHGVGIGDARETLEPQGG